MVSQNRIEQPLEFTFSSESQKKRYAVILLPSNDVADNNLRLGEAMAYMSAFNRAVRGTAGLCVIVDQQSIARYATAAARRAKDPRAVGP